MNKKIIFIFLGIILSSSFCFAAETVTITTYYPAPYGVYNVLRLFPNDSFTPGAACANNGEMYYDSSDNQFYYCSTNWKPLGGGYWSQATRGASDIGLYPTDLSSVVGIGTNTPGRFGSNYHERLRLHVRDPLSVINSSNISLLRYVTGGGSVIGTTSIIEGWNTAALQIMSEYESGWMSHLILSGIDINPADGTEHNHWVVSAWGPNWNNRFNIGHIATSSQNFALDSVLPNDTSANSFFTITKDGNVGIGSDNPASKLEVFGDLTSIGKIGWALVNRDMWFDGGADGVFLFANVFHDASNNFNGKTIFGRQTNLSGGFTRTMTILHDGAGKVGIGYGATDPTYDLDVNGTARFKTSLLWTNIDPVHQLAGNSTYDIQMDGSGFFKRCPVASSRRYKKDITDLEFDSSKIYSLRPVSFTWKEFDARSFGLIAEEVAEVLPQLVDNDEEGKPNSVKYKELSVLLLAELKKLKSKIDNLENQISALKQRQLP